MSQLARLSLFVIVVSLTALPVSALTEKPVVRGSLEELVMGEPGPWTGRVVEPAASAVGRLANGAAWEAYLSEQGRGAAAWVDARTGEPTMVRCTPEAWVPGPGNELDLDDVANVLGRSVAEVNEAMLQDLGREFIGRRQDLLRVPAGELVARRAEQVTGQLWVVTFEQQIGDVVVEGSRLTLVVGHGNLILWGTDNLFPAAEGTARAAAIDAAAALEAVRAHVGWRGESDRVVQEPELRYRPAFAGGDRSQAPVHQLVWELGFVREGVTGSWLAHVDAVTGELVSFGDVNAYAWARGGIYPKTWTDAEQMLPVPLADLTPGGFTSTEGLFTPSGGTDQASLDGQLAEIEDQCGTAGYAVVESGPNSNIDFGDGPPNPLGDADCTTNGIGVNGGAHNTHASRSAYYHITWIKEKGRRWLPSNSWLASSHLTEVNIDDVCNAFWSPFGGYNGFYMEGIRYDGLHCYNTGEIAAVFLHEVGHGLDQYDVQGTADGGTGEAYADMHAMLHLHDSCIGDGFAERQCTGYGLPCTDCTGVRDADYAKHVEGDGTPVDYPLTPANFTGVYCDSGSGPCGHQVHCESYPATGALWDLSVRKLPTGMSQATAWYVTERDWYLGMQISTSMYNCSSSTYASNGCATTSWYQAMLAADDDDGNLTNGTPHASALFEAFDDHAIACGSASDAANTSSSGCPTLAAPTLTAAPAGTSIELSWTAVASADSYVVLRNHGDCAGGYLRVATVAAGTTTFSDTEVADYTPYSYRVLAQGASESCYSELSACQLATLSDCPSAVSAAPGLSNLADNQVDLSWDASGTCSGFNVYRRTGGCAEAGFEKIATGVAGSTASDTAVWGGITYGYRVTGLNPAGELETGLSPCAEITPTGICNAEPAFAGVTAVTNSHTEACGLDVNWNQGSTICSGQPVVYNVYRSTSEVFTPDEFTRVARGVSGGAWHDYGVEYGPTYYYIVRAEALSGLGTGPNGGAEDGNLMVLDGKTSGPDTNLLADDVEAGNQGDWTPVAGDNDGSDTDPWNVVDTASHSGTRSWFCEDEGSVKEEILQMSAAVDVPAGEPTVLEFWHRVSTESGYDGGVLEYSTDGGATWYDILAGNGGSIPADAERFLAGGYNDTLSTCCSNPIPGRDAWAGSIGWTLVEVDLTDFAGASLMLRWRFGCDSGLSGDGWYVDDVRVFFGSSCTLDTDIFADGFESGDANVWSNQSPE